MKHLLLLCFWVISQILVCNGQIPKSGFAEHCNGTLKCDKKSWLVCGAESTCVCMFPEEMIYDNESSVCQSKAGERCLFQVANFQDVDSGLLTLYEKTPCVQEAECASTGICTCNNGFFETYTGSCSPQKSVGSACSVGLECNSANFLSCINGTCNCESTQQVAHDGACYGKAGKAVSAKGCVPGTILGTGGKCTCTNETEEYVGEDGLCHEKKDFMGSCLQDSHCKSDVLLTCLNGTCVCDPATSKFEVLNITTRRTFSGSCGEVFRQAYGDPSYWCEKGSVPCKSGTRCIPVRYICDGGADCPGREDELSTLCQTCGRGNGAATVSIENSVPFPQCVGLAGQQCNSSTHCLSNSNCIDGICKCAQGFAKTSSGKCQQGYQQNCSSQLPCGDQFRCTDRGCDCPSPGYQIYNAAISTDKCLSLILGSCNLDTDCIENAKCEKTAARNYKQCVCKIGYVENIFGTCDLAHGSPCEYNDRSNFCDRKAELQCADGVCSCSNAVDHFEHKTRKCLSVEGSRCGNSRLINSSHPVATSCVEHASCLVNDDQSGGVCVCDEGNEVSNTTASRLCNTALRTIREA